MKTVSSGTPADQHRTVDGELHPFARRRLLRRRSAQTWPPRRRRSLVARLRERLARLLGRLLPCALVAVAVPALVMGFAALAVTNGRPTARAAGASVDVDDTSRCPLGAGCESCGAVDDLAVATAETAVGVLCLTLCGSCGDAGDLPRFPSWSAAIRRVGQHCEHLGVDVDEAAEARRRRSCPRCTTSNVADLGGYFECRECGHGFTPAR